MREEFSPRVASDRRVEQAVVAMKKGAYLLKCGRRGKPRFCPFRLSSDENFLIWYSGNEEKQLSLSSVNKVICGQSNLVPDKQSQSLSLIYANGDRLLDLICKDKTEAEIWSLGLKAVISRYYLSGPFTGFRNPSGTQTCVNSPAGLIRRKHNLGLPEDNSGISQVRSLCGSPSLSLSGRCFSEGPSFSSDSIYSSESSFSEMHSANEKTHPTMLHLEPKEMKKTGLCYTGQVQKNSPQRLPAPKINPPCIDSKENLMDVLMWGEGVSGNLGGGINGLADDNAARKDSLFPVLIESAVALEVRNISLGKNHAALVTKQGDVFCWGDANGGKLGHNINMNLGYPKLVEALSGVHIKNVACGEYQTFAVTHDGELYNWGANDFNSSSIVDERCRSQWVPQRVRGILDGIRISFVSCGLWHSALVSTLGELFTYGDGTFGVLGHGNIQGVHQPKEVEALRGVRVKSVSCGSWHTAAIVEVLSDHTKFNGEVGKLYTWGDGDKGRLGHNDQGRKLLPMCVEKLLDHDFVQVSCGRTFTVALTNTGKVYTMGSALCRELGNPLAMDKSVKIVEGDLKKEFVKQIATGAHHTVALTSGGRLYAWGKGTNGQLGLGDTEDRHLPTLVNAICDRKVENISCGSNVTAAICIHKPLSISDQSSCSKCKLPFGFTRKKHNCYNCGFLFCNACSSKRIMNASLATNRNKPSRVCDACYFKLKSNIHLHRILEGDSDSQTRLSNQKIRSMDEIEEMVKASFAVGSAVLNNQHYVKDWNSCERQILKDQQKDRQGVVSVSSILAELPRWGKVQCPAQFERHQDHLAVSPISKVQPNPISPLHSQRRSRGSNFSFFSAMYDEEGFSKSSKMLTEEVDMLRYEVSSLEKKWLTGRQKIQEHKKKLEETWSLAGEEAAKCKAAKVVVKNLAMKLNKLAKKSSDGNEERDSLGGSMSRCTKIDTDSPTLKGISHVKVANQSTDKLIVTKDMRVGSVCSSPLLAFTSRLIHGANNCEDNLNMTNNYEDNANMVGPPQSNFAEAGQEWMEQYEPGIYLTFTILPNGRKGLKRVRFSRKHYSEKKAEQWWEENQARVYKKYDIEAYSKSGHPSVSNLYK